MNTSGVPTVTALLLSVALPASGCLGGAGADAPTPDSLFGATDAEVAAAGPRSSVDTDRGGSGTCSPARQGQVLAGDKPGVLVFGTGHLGADSIRVVVAAGALVEFDNGTFLEPKQKADQVDGKRPQRMMIAERAVLMGPGEFLVDANCMEAQQATPDEDAEFYSCAREPTTSTELCQKDCGDCQECIWACETAPDGTTPLECGRATQTDDTFYVVDDCDDGFPLLYRLFDRSSGLAWPLDGGTYETGTLGSVSCPDFTCVHGTRVCLGGETKGGGGWSLGVGLDGTLPESDDWCATCGASAVTGWTLSCE